MSAPAGDGRRRVVLVSGLSGAGKSSILRALEDLDYEAVDNAPLTLIETLASRGERHLAVGVDARTRGFDDAIVLETLERLRLQPALRPELVYALADEAVLLRRFTETRRRHPLAPHAPVAEGISAETACTARLRVGADLLLDTSELTLPGLRRRIEAHFGPQTGLGVGAAQPMLVSLVSFAFPEGLPREADLVFDARFLRNPYYDLRLRPLTGLNPEVGRYVAEDPDFCTFLEQIESMVGLLLPRFLQEGKKYATIAIGCTGGRHRSVYLAERLAASLGTSAGALPGWRVGVTHRELEQDAAAGALRSQGA